MKSIITKATHLYRLILRDLSALTDIDLSRDFMTVEARVQHEGLPFLTRTLPEFGDKFFLSLQTGTLQPSSAFKLKGALPKFLIGLTSRVFDAKTGVLLQDPCYVSAYAVRQVCYLLYKMEMPYSSEQVDIAVNKMVECDRTLDGRTHLSPFDKVLLLASNLISEILGPFQWDDITPRQGPGASAQPVPTPWDKWHFIGDGSEDLPYDLFETPGLASTGFNSTAGDTGRCLDLLDQVCDLRQSKVSAVPKTSKGPRIISAEAVRLMWAQLGIDDLIRRRVEQHNYCAKSICFRDQTVNASKALHASFTGTHATIDLSEASDRVSMKLIGNLFPTTWVRAIERTRSTGMRLPSGYTLDDIAKVAPMGNGYCFSVESLVFWGLSAATIACCMGEVYTNEDDLEWACQNTSVYGDDIIIPTQYAGEVMSSLERYGFRINRDKSFWTGPFRESCGCDAFNGIDITPLKIKTPPRSTNDSVDADFVSSWWDQSMTWSHLLPETSAWMKEQVYANLRYKPTYPSGWEGCIGEPCDYENLHGRLVKAGAMNVPFFQKAIRGPLHKNSFVLIKEDNGAPSDGKLVKVVRIKSATSRPPKEGTDFTEEHGYMRWLSSCLGRGDSYEPFDPYVFTLRYASKVTITREWAS